MNLLFNSNCTRKILTRFDSQNKPNGQFQIPSTREAVMDFMRNLPVRKVPGIGRVGERVLQAIGVEVCLCQGRVMN